MARINIEDRLYKDDRFINLMLKLGSVEAALGALMRAFTVAQIYWFPDRKGIPVAVFERSLKKELLEVGLAELRDGSVYIKGSEEQFAWLFTASVRGSVGGKKSVSGRERDELGRLMPRKDIQAPLGKMRQAGSNNPSGSKPLTLTPPLSPSLKQNTKIPSEQTAVAVEPPEGWAVVPNKPTAPARKERWTENTREKMRVFYAAYSEGYRAKYGGQPEGIRDKAILGKVGAWIEHVSAERATALIQAYLQIDYRPIAESQHDLWQFFRHLNRIGNALNSGNPSEINWGAVFGASA